MSENNYGALMLKSALDTSVDVSKIIAPGIYPVIAGNASAPDSSAGLMTVVLTATSQKTTFQKESSSVVYSLINGKWKKPEPGDVGNFGTAAFCDVTTSRNDNTLGRVLKIGDRNLGGTVIPASHGFNFNSYEFAAGETLFIEVNAAINFPAGMSELANTFVYVNVIGIRDSGNDCALLLSRYDTNISYLAWRKQVGASRAWQVLKIPATATDIGALPITGGDLLGRLGFVFQDARTDANCTIVSIDANGKQACIYGYYQDRFDIHFYDENGAWASNPLSIGRNGNTTVSGNLSGRAVYEGNTRVYSPNNPQPIDLSGYATQSWVLQNFVQNIDLTAPTEFQFWDGRGYMRATDGAAMYNFSMVGGSSNVGWIVIRYTRKLVNNTWYVIN